MEYPSLEEIDELYPEFDSWWRKKYGYFTISPRASLGLFRKFLLEIGFGDKKRILPFQSLKRSKG